MVKLLWRFLRIDGRKAAHVKLVRLHPRKEVGLKQEHLKGQQHKQLGAVWSFLREVEREWQAVLIGLKIFETLPC